MLNCHNFETVAIEALRQKCGQTHKCQHCKRSQTLGSFRRTTAACKSGRRLWRRLDERARLVCSALFWLCGRLGSAWHSSIYSCVVISPLPSCPFFWSTRIAHILSFELKQFEFRRRWALLRVCAASGKVVSNGAFLSTFSQLLELKNVLYSRPDRETFGGGRICWEYSGTDVRLL